LEYIVRTNGTTNYIIKVNLIQGTSGSGTSFGITIGDGTTVPSTGSKGFVTVGFAGTIVSWYITANASGSCVVDLKRSGTTIIGSGNKPTLATAQRANALANSSWTSKVVTKYDEFEFNLDSVATCTRINFVFFVEI